MKEVKAMMMLTKENEKNLPALYAEEDTPTNDKMVWVKYFQPWGKSWTWYATEWSPTERVFFGYVDGDFPEWGYFSLDELESIRGPFGLKIERDMHFKPKKFGEINLAMRQ